MGIPKPNRLDDGYDLLPSNYPPLHSKKPSFSRLGRITLLTLAGVAFFTFLGCNHCLYSPRNFYSHKQRNPAYLISVRNGAVASENKRCSDIGVSVLKEGGNAVDAAVATTFCIGVVNMFSSGIGGGGFMTIRIPPTDPDSTNSEVYTIDFRETAPALANTTMYVSNPKTSLFGGLAVGVPGEIRGLEEAHRRWGNLPWERLIEPSISLAQGWEVDKELGRRIPWFANLFLTNLDWASIFAPNGRLLREGEIIRRTNLSLTLTKVAREGADAFYTGSVADAIVRKVQLEGGILSHADLKNYSVKVERALEGTYRDKKIYTTHAPTSGPVLLHMLNLVEKYDMKEMNALNVHRLLEVMKFGFAARTKVSDPNFINVTESIDEIPRKSFADKIFPNITDDRTHPPEYYNPVFDVKTDHGTVCISFVCTGSTLTSAAKSHTSVVDKNGMAVALTSTVNLVFGSQVLDPVTGIIFNDEMDDFSTPGIPNAFGLWPSPFNYPEPGKRPLSSTAPTIIEHADGSFHLAIGGSGGSRIFPSIFQVLLNLGWGMDVSQAIEFGRLHDQLYPLLVDADNVYPPKILQDLQNRGHNVTVSDVNRVAAVIQAVLSDKNMIYAASDSRKNGIAAGY